MSCVDVGTRARDPSGERVVFDRREHVRSRDVGTADSIHVLIADRSCLIRAALRTLLEADPQIAVAGEAATGDQVLTLARATQPDVVVMMDVALPIVKAVQVTRRICS